MLSRRKKRYRQTLICWTIAMMMTLGTAFSGMGALPGEAFAEYGTKENSALSTDVPLENQKEVPAENEMPTETPVNPDPANPLSDPPVENPTDPSNDPTDPIDTPVDPPGDVPSDPVDTPADPPVENPADNGSETNPLLPLPDDSAVSNSSSGVIEEFEDLSGLTASTALAAAELSLASRPETIYYGYHAARLSYDFTVFQQGTSAAYINFKDPDGSTGRTLSGNPKSMGLWVYGDGGNHWLRAVVLGASGEKSTIDLTSSSGLSWNGWKYVTFDLPSHLSSPMKLSQIYVVETNANNKNKGAIYFDRLTALYSDSKVYALDITGLTPMQTGESQRAIIHETYAGLTEPAVVTEGVKLSSSDESIAMVTGSAHDTVEALAPGEVTITAQYGDAPATTFHLKISDEMTAPHSLELSGPVRLEESATGKMKAYAKYDGYDDPLPLIEGVAFNSSHPDILSVNDEGYLTALSTGSVVITVSYKGISAEHPVTVEERIPVLKSIELRGLTGVDIGDSFDTITMASYTWMEEPVQLTEGVQYSSSKPEVASVDEKGRVTGHMVGASRITATYGGKTSSLYMTVNQPSELPKAEMRAAWIATVENIDWPEKGAAPEAQKQQYIDLLNQLEAAGMNAVIMQIKPTADAFYPSEYGPWSEWLTGQQGKDPGYNPLAFLIEETHKRNMEFHAWFNPYRVSMKDDINRLVEDHPARQHTDWVVSYGGKLFFNPGIPEAQKFILDSIMEVVRNYDIDAVHFDDYFYPYPSGAEDFPDDDTFAKYGGEFTDKGDWRRDNVNQFVKDVSEAIKAEKSYVKFGISPFGIWRNKSTSVPDGSDTNGLSSYDAIFADSKKWIDEGWIDYITPQIYWYRGYSPAAYDKLIEWWSDVIEDKNVHLYSGQAIYRVGSGSGWLDPEEMPNQIKYNRSFEQVKGSMYFSAKWFEDNPLGFTDRLREDLYRYPALVPTMPWLDDEAPAAPAGLTARDGQEGVRLSWKSKGDEAYYAIYRFTDKEQRDVHDPANLLKTVRKQEGSDQSFMDTTAADNGKYTYVVTAVDRLHNESKGSSPATVHVRKGGGIPAEPEPPYIPPSTTPPATTPVTPTQPGTPQTPPDTSETPVKPPAESTKPAVFKDADQVPSWAKEAMDELTATGIMKGFGDNTIRPLKPVTRAEFLAMLVRAFELTGESASVSMKDIKPSDWYYEIVAAGLESGIVKGVGGDKFEPNRSITREEMAVMSANVLKQMKGMGAVDADQALSKLKDKEKIAPYAKSAVALLWEEGIMNGTGADRFMPKGIANRAQAAVVIWNLLHVK
ncbi:family 10 glycosylhydrolase [Paenibacillus faecalis]|uniref:family 10 glycosylhydrolase n=1 Tax=Paenibacillus faecalis TaxID=2079532 RepID=UPI001F2C8E8D|nr:family 10 glycosylhydrolase [Paenibacillus faecalis]